MAVEATTVVSFNAADSTTPYLFKIVLDDTLNVETNEAALEQDLQDEGEFESSPYLQILTKYYYPSSSRDISKGVVTDTDVNEETVITTFPPGSDIYLLANRSSNVSIDDVRVTDGSIVSQGVVSRSGEESNLFTGIEDSADDEYQLSVVPSNVTTSYMGNTGRLDQATSNTGITTFLHNVNYAPFLADFAYDYSCNLYKLQSPTMTIEEDETYSIAVVFYITVSEA